MARWMISLAAAGFLGAAIFYSPYIGIDAQTQLVCTLCPHVTIVGGAPLEHFIRLTIGGGILNAASFMFAGCIVMAIARNWKRVRI